MSFMCDWKLSYNIYMYLSYLFIISIYLSVCLSVCLQYPLQACREYLCRISTCWSKFNVSTRVRFLRFDPVNSSFNATEVSQCVFRDSTKLSPLNCLKNPINIQLSVKRAWDISVLKYINRFYWFFTPVTHQFLDHSASLSVRVTTDTWE